MPDETHAGVSLPSTAARDEFSLRSLTRGLGLLWLGEDYKGPLTRIRASSRSRPLSPCHREGSSSSVLREPSPHSLAAAQHDPGQGRAPELVRTHDLGGEVV